MQNQPVLLEVRTAPHALSLVSFEGNTGISHPDEESLPATNSVCSGDSPGPGQAGADSKVLGWCRCDSYSDFLAGERSITPISQNAGREGFDSNDGSRWHTAPSQTSVTPSNMAIAFPGRTMTAEEAESNNLPLISQWTGMIPMTTAQDSVKTFSPTPFSPCTSPIDQDSPNISILASDGYLAPQIPEAEIPWSIPPTTQPKASGFETYATEDLDTQLHQMELASQGITHGSSHQPYGLMSESVAERSDEESQYGRAMERTFSTSWDRDVCSSETECVRRPPLPSHCTPVHMLGETTDEDNIPRWIFSTNPRRSVSIEPPRGSDSHSTSQDSPDNRSPESRRSRHVHQSPPNAHLAVSMGHITCSTCGSLQEIDIGTLGSTLGHQILQGQSVVTRWSDLQPLQFVSHPSEMAPELTQHQHARVESSAAGGNRSLFEKDDTASQLSLQQNSPQQLDAGLTTEPDGQNSMIFCTY